MVVVSISSSVTYNESGIISFLFDVTVYTPFIFIFFILRIVNFVFDSIWEILLCCLLIVLFR